MDIVYLIILAAAGVGFGAFLPELCDKTAAYKLKKSGTNLEPNRFFSSWATKLFMGVCNGAAWYLLGLVFVSVSSLIIACVIVYRGARTADQRQQFVDGCDEAGFVRGAK